MMKFKFKQDEGIIFAVLSSVFSSMSTVIASVGTKSITPLLFLSLSGLLGSVFLFLMSVYYKQRLDLAKIRKNIRDVADVAVFRGVIGSALLMIGLSISTGIEAIFFTKMEPYFVLIYNWIFLHQKISRKHIALICVHLFGVFLLATGGILVLSRSSFGDILIIAAVALFAHTYVSGKKLSNEIGAINSNLVTFGAGAVVILPIAVAIIVIQKPVLGSAGFEYLLPYTILFNVLTLTLWFAALKKLEGWLVSAVRAVGPLIAAPFAYILFGETLGYVQIVGGILILTTSFILSYEHRKK